MPLIEKSSYRAPWLMRLGRGHIATVFTNLFRVVPKLNYQRESLDTSDGDFLDLDLLEGSHAGQRGRVVILVHGLEGSTQAQYIRGMTLELQKQLGCTTVGFNLRGCSGRPNRTVRSYHSGATEDLQAVVQWTEQRFPNSEIALVGFSLGGNNVLKYLGEGIRRNSVVGGVAISVPCELTGAAEAMSKPLCKAIYMRKFMGGLVRKLERKNTNLGTQFDLSRFRKMTTFAEFDDAYTAPVHGFGTAENYWIKNSSRQFMHRIDVPTLLINAMNDPFLSESCIPHEVARKSLHFHLETPEHGGHVGFIDSVVRPTTCWQERRTVEFLEQFVFKNDSK